MSTNIFLIVGTPGSGKDILIRAVKDMGSLHAVTVPKHTSRRREGDDGPEMICSDDPEFDLENCDIAYENYGNSYGMKSRELWELVGQGKTLIIVVSNKSAINQIMSMFRDLVRTIFILSEMDEEKYRINEKSKGFSEDYIESRVKEYKQAYDIYYANFTQFDHVLIYADADEDLYDQIFRLFTEYEKRVQ